MIFFIIVGIGFVYFSKSFLLFALQIYQIYQSTSHQNLPNFDDWRFSANYLLLILSHSKQENCVALLVLDLVNQLIQDINSTS